MSVRYSHSRRSSLPAGVLFGATLLASACVLPGRGRADEPPPLQSPARDTLLAADRARSDSVQRVGQVESMRMFISRDAAYLHPGAPIVYGLDNAIALVRASAPKIGAVASLEPISGGLARDGLSGYTFGIAVRSETERSALSTERYLAFWSRQRGTPWRIIAYIEITPGAAAWSGGAGATEAFPRFEGPRAAALRSMVAADSAFADRTSAYGLASAARTAVAEDGILLAASQLIVGPRAAFAYFESRRDLSLSWSPRDGYVAGSGDLGLTVGDQLATSRGATGAVAQHFTKYLTVWRRDPVGRWRVVASGFNARPSPIGD
jgi:ketosteroid isomerase-like protein